MPELARGSAKDLEARGVSEARVARFVDSMGALPEKVYRDVVRCLTTFNRRADLERVSQPALCLAGDDEATAPARTMEKMAAAMPQGEYACIKGGHLLPNEAPEAVAEAVNAFLAKLD